MRCVGVRPGVFINSVNHISTLLSDDGCHSPQLSHSLFGSLHTRSAPPSPVIRRVSSHTRGCPDTYRACVAVHRSKTEGVLVDVVAGCSINSSPGSSSKHHPPSHHSSSMKPTKVYRDAAGPQTHAKMEKRGSLADGVDAAHKLSHRVAQEVLSTLPGRPLHVDNVIPAMNSAGNLRVKSQYGNRCLDERRDMRIVAAVHGNGVLTEVTTFHRAAQSYVGACAVADRYKDDHGGRESKQLEALCQELGNLTLHDGRVGRPRKVANLPRGGLYQ